MVCDFQVIKQLLKDFLDGWDHALCLNTDDPNFAFYERAYGNRIIPFRHADPTSEMMVKAIFDELKPKLAGIGNPPAATGNISSGVRLERVRLTETSSSWAEYSE